MKQDLRYTHGDVFETFPFPGGAIEDSTPALSDIGSKYFDMRAEYMLKEKKGMTKAYNDLHNPECNIDAICALRDLQMQLNILLASAYGFNDIELDQDFHEVAYLPEGKNLRFTISESAREEVLYRLAMLNKKRHEEENGSVTPLRRNNKNNVYPMGDDREKTLDKVPENAPQIDIFGQED